jgi:hypothetical protein
MAAHHRADKETDKLLEHTLKTHQEELHKADVTVSVLFTEDLNDKKWPAYAMVKITKQRDRCLGVDDAVITIDQDRWNLMAKEQRVAILDHELEHLEVVYEDNGDVAVDESNRPKLKIRKHSHQFGWHDAVAKRHGKNSIEVMQALAFIESSGQIYLPGFQPDDEAGDDIDKALKNLGKATKSLKASLKGAQITLPVAGVDEPRDPKHDQDNRE